jgi:hypothetical protein
MELEFQIHLALLNRQAEVKKSSYFLSILREGLYSVSVERVPLIQYYAFFDSPVKGEQIKVKVYKTVADGKWYDKLYSEEAEINSPEFGIPAINEEVKQAIDVFEESLKKREALSR